MGGGANSSSATGINVFTQLEEPEKKEGIWVQTDDQYENIIVDNELFNSDIDISETIENFMPITVNDNPSYIMHTCTHKNNIFMTFNQIGTDYDNLNTKLYRYDGNAWTNIINILYKTYGDACGIFSFNNKLYIIFTIRGDYASVHYNSLYYYDETTSTIKREASLPRTDEIQGIFLYNNKLNVFGGGHIAIYDFTNKTFTEALYNNINGSYDSAIATFPAVYNGKIYVNYSGALSVFEYNKFPVNISPSSNGGCAKFSINNKLYQFGNEYNAYKCIYIYDGATTTADYDHFPFMNGKCVGVMLKNQIYIFGGYWYNSSGNSEYSGNKTAIITFTEKSDLAPNTIYLSKGNTGNGVYNINLVNLKQGTACLDNSVKLIFDDIFYCGNNGIDWQSPIYIGDGTKWIRIKN